MDYFILGKYHFSHLDTSFRLIIFLIIFLIKLIKFDFPLKLKRKALKSVELPSKHVGNYLTYFELCL